MNAFDAATALWECEDLELALKLAAGFASSAANSYLEDDIYSREAQALEELGDHLWLASQYVEKAFPKREGSFPKEEEKK